MTLIKNIKIHFLCFGLIIIICLLILKINNIKNKIVVSNSKIIIVEKGISERNFLKELKKTNIKITNLEWYLTKLFFNRNFSIKYGEYNFDKNTTLYNFQKKLKQKKILDKYWPTRAINNIIKSKKDALVLASIIEKESGKKSELKLVSSVFINRLKMNMKLQSDVTVAYGLNILGNKLNKKHLKIKNSYNTYLNYGLPPTPISYPGEHAIKAALNPMSTNYLYFVSDGKGGHRFSKTYAKHKQNIKLWLETRGN